MFRFTIRDVLWLTVVAACLLGWWNEHRRLQAYREKYEIKWTFDFPVPAAPARPASKSATTALSAPN